MSNDSAAVRLLTNKSFWISVTASASVALIVYDWYSDRYATPLQRYNRVKNDYIISVKDLRKIRSEFVQEMRLGLMDDPKKKSILKMLHSNITKVPTGNEKGVYYGLDWGGTNYRVLRIEFKGNQQKPNITETKAVITSEYQHCQNPEIFFDFLSEKIKHHMHEYKEDVSNKEISIGFTFSFPIKQPSLNKAILIEWTKGFTIPGVPGKNVTELMHNSFKKYNIPGQIKAVCNDTVSTLLAGAFEYQNVRMGLILGTGTNACYIEPSLNNEIINIEWGAYNKNLPRMPTDFIMDEYTPNPGLQYAEKMCSGFYLGEITRLLLIEVFREKITKYGDSTLLNFKWKFESKDCSKILSYHYNNATDEILNMCYNDFNLCDFELSDASVLGNCCKLIVDRSADIVSCLMLGSLEKTGLYQTFRNDVRNPYENDRFVLDSKYKNSHVSVAIDGSVFSKVPKYKERMLKTIKNIVGIEISEKIKLVHSEDGSGKGAALAVATCC